MEEDLLLEPQPEEDFDPTQEEILAVLATTTQTEDLFQFLQDLYVPAPPY